MHQDISRKRRPYDVSKKIPDGKYILNFIELSAKIKNIYIVTTPTDSIPNPFCRECGSPGVELSALHTISDVLVISFSIQDSIKFAFGPLRLRRRLPYLLPGVALLCGSYLAWLRYEMPNSPRLYDLGMANYVS